MTSIIVNTGILVFVYMTLWFLLSIFLKRHDIADIAWGMGFSVVTVFLLLTNERNVHLWIITILTILWGLRLSIHITIRNHQKKEDFRYLSWRKSWGKYFFVRSYLQVFLLQGLFMLLISSSAIIASLPNSQGLHGIAVIGITLWCIGFFFESVGDYQLMKFKSYPGNHGLIMKTGLWRYTRHPNYFGEVIQWWGLFMTVVTLPYGIIAIISPLTITFLILGVSGVPMLEKKYIGNKEFEEYKKTTSPFFPWFTKSIHSEIGNEKDTMEG